MRSLTMEESVRRDGLKGYVRVQVEPSVQVRPGVHFSVNDHYEVGDPESVIGSDEIINILERSWSESLKRSDQITKLLLERR